MSFGLIAAVLNATQKTLPDHVTGEADRVIAAIPAASSGTWHFEEFLTSGTWTRPAGVDVVWVLAVGGGAGGGRSGGNTHCGGGGGEIVFRPVNVTGNVTVTIGAGGAGATTTLQVGTAGGDTTFGTAVTARGAPGGDASRHVPAGANNIWSYGGGAWENKESYFIAIPSMFGVPGGFGLSIGSPTATKASGVSGFGNGGDGVGGGGGSFGDGGAGGATPVAAAANTGGGGGASTTTNTNGAAGGSGRVQVFWFI